MDKFLTKLFFTKLFYFLVIILGGAFVWYIFVQSIVIPKEDKSMPFYFVLNFIFCFFNYYIAKKRNKSGVRWLFLSFAFTSFICYLALIAVPIEKRDNNQA